MPVKRVIDYAVSFQLARSHFDKARGWKQIADGHARFPMRPATSTRSSLE